MPEDKAWVEKGRRLQQSLAHPATHGLALGGGESPRSAAAPAVVIVTPPRGKESGGVWYDDDGNPSPWVCKHCQFKSFSRAEVLGPFPGHAFTCERNAVVVKGSAGSAEEGKNSGGSSQAARRSSRKATPRREWKGDGEDGAGRSGGSMDLARSPKAATMVLGFNGGRCVASTTPPSPPPSMFPHTAPLSSAHPLDLLPHASMSSPAAKSKPKNNDPVNTLSRLLSLEDALTIAAALHSTARPSSCTLRETNEGAIVVDLVTASAGKGRFHRSADILVLHPFGGAGGAGGAGGSRGGGVVVAEALHMPSSPVLLRFEATMNTTSSTCDQTTHIFPQVCQDGVVTHGVNGCIENGALLQNSPHCFDQTSVAAFRRTGKLAGAGKNKRTQRSSSSSSASSSKKVNSGPSSPTQRAKRRTTSAFVVFVQDTRPSLAQVRPDLSFDEMGRTIGRMWGALSPEDKAPYEARAALDTARKERHLQERLSRHSSAGLRGARRGARGARDARADAATRRRVRGGCGARGSSSDDGEDEDDASRRSNEGNAFPPTECHTEDALSLDDLLRQELSCVTSISSMASTTNTCPLLAMATTPPSTTPATTPPSNS